MNMKLRRLPGMIVLHMHNFANDFEGSDEIVKRVGTLAKDYGGS